MFTRGVALAAAAIGTAAAAMRHVAQPKPRAEVLAKLTAREIQRRFGGTDLGRYALRCGRLRRKSQLGRAGAY